MEAILTVCGPASREGTVSWALKGIAKAEFIHVPAKGAGEKCITFCPCCLFSHIWTVMSFGLVSVKGMLFIKEQKNEVLIGPVKC